MLFNRKISFNTWLFLILALQYALMHLFSLGLPASITSFELVVFIVYTISQIMSFFYKGKRATSGSVSGLVPLFFSVLWTVAFFSHLQREACPVMLIVMISLGMFTALFMLMSEYIFLIKD